jgi:putative transposase
MPPFRILNDSPNGKVMDYLEKHKLCKRYNHPGELHFLTFACFRNQPFLKYERPKQWLADSLKAACQKHDFKLNAYVFMPTHVHLLVGSDPTEYNISLFLLAIKKPVTLKARQIILANRGHRNVNMFMDRQPNGTERFRFWQRGGGYDRNVISAVEMIEKVTYIHNNPVRAGLSQLPEVYAWSSACAYEGKDCGRVPIVPLPL